jgi:CheY-like chemotaxis protein
MPEMDGLAATASIRAAERGGSTHLPIVAITAHALQGDRTRFLASGMDGYISKPIRSLELLEAIRSAICKADMQTRTAVREVGTGEPLPE